MRSAIAEAAIPSFLAWLLDHWGNQIGGTFLAPGSSHSIGALGCTLVVAMLCVAPLSRKTRLRVLFRALFPRRLLGSRSGRTDIAYSIFSLFFSGLAFGWALVSADQVQAFVAPMLGDMFGARPHLEAGIVARATITAGAFIVFEFAYWLDHYLSHRLRFLWQFHAVHHSAHHLSLLTNFRVHPIDTVVFYNIVAICLGLFFGCINWACGGAIDPYTIGGTNALIMICAVGLTHLQHSHLWTTFGPRWGRWFLSPAHHQIHHSASREHFDRNFGSTLAVWDRLFRTLHLPSKERMALRFGVDDLGYDPHTARGAIAGPVISAWRSLCRDRDAVAGPSLQS